MSDELIAYDIGRADAVFLLTLLQGDAVPARSNADLLNLLRQTLLLSKSLNENCREWLEMAAICHGDMMPYAAEKLNIPTLQGALSAAVTIPRVEDSDCCATCAFRVGSPANQTVATAADIFDCLQDREMFMCHHGVDEMADEEPPRKPCRGYVKAFIETKPAESAL